MTPKAFQQAPPEGAVWLGQQCDVNQCFVSHFLDDSRPVSFTALLFIFLDLAMLHS
jgi:hypothetical protein